MDKARADMLITEYTRKIFGFALGKTGVIDEAEELAARITLEVYASFLRGGEIYNVDGYVYRIAKNVYARYVSDEKNRDFVSLDGAAAQDDFVAELENAEAYRLLRREIAYLSKTQREIVVLYYFDRLSQKQIAKRLSIPAGTVKWHLHEAKGSLKEGINMKREQGTLGIKPIQFASMGINGSTGRNSKGETSVFLQKRITQNIAYAAYWEPKTINEIAEELGVSPLFVEDEVAVLEEYAFMDKLPGGKYRTNMWIAEKSKDYFEKHHELAAKYAAVLCEKYAPQVIEAARAWDNKDIYVPDNDENLLLWSAIPYAVGYKLLQHSFDFTKFSVKRPDGGDYIAHATLFSDDAPHYNYDKYSACGNMTDISQKYDLLAWQLNTFYDNREGSWLNNLTSDYDFVYEYFTGAIKKEPSQIEKYERLREKNYLDEQDTVNLIIIRDNSKSWIPLIPFTDALPGLTDELRTIADEYDAAVYELQKPLFPEHMQPLVRAYSRDILTHNITRTHMLEQLLDSGVLKPPAENRRAGLCTLMFSDKLR